MSQENLGEFLSGDRIDNSPYELFMREDSQCNILCQKTYKAEDAEAFMAAIDEEYHHNWIIDNLPAASIVGSATTVHADSGRTRWRSPSRTARASPWGAATSSLWSRSTKPRGGQRGMWRTRHTS